MNFKMKALSVLLIISVFLLSSCEVYQTLYGKPASVPDSKEATGNVVMEQENEMDDTSEQNNEDDTEAEETSDDLEETQETEEETQASTETQEETTGEEIEEETDDDAVFVEPSGDAIVVTVDETELVSLVPKAEDPDSDSQLQFTFTSPLDESGKWQTTYGDNGEYTVTVTVSDGELTTTQDVLVIVNKKEEAPVIGASKPLESTVTIDETDAVEFSAEASDLNKDKLDYQWKLDGNEVSSDSDYKFESTYDDSGSHTVKVDVSDGSTSASKLWSVDVKNVNRKPVLEALNNLEVRETEPVVIVAVASDADNDKLTYEISDERFKVDDNVFTWETDYSSAGTYEVTVKVSDGKDTTEQAFDIKVENVNRPPRIVEIAQK